MRHFQNFKAETNNCTDTRSRKVRSAPCPAQEQMVTAAGPTLLLKPEKTDPSTVCSVSHSPFLDTRGRPPPSICKDWRWSDSSLVKDQQERFPSLQNLKKRPLHRIHYHQFLTPTSWRNVAFILAAATSKPPKADSFATKTNLFFNLLPFYRIKMKTKESNICNGFFYPNNSISYSPGTHHLVYELFPEWSSISFDILVTVPNPSQDAVTFLTPEEKKKNNVTPSHFAPWVKSDSCSISLPVSASFAFSYNVKL